MRKEASLEQWRELYEVAIKIKALKPWEFLWDTELITIILPEYEEPFYCSVMGRNGECYAIGTYAGYNAINGFCTIMEREDIPDSQIIRYQNNLMCYFGNRDELSKKEYQLIKDLGLKFRGRNQWIYFNSFEPGYAPYILDEEEVVQLTLVFKQLYMALRYYIEDKIMVDFEEGKILLRFYDDQKGLWLTAEAPLFIPPAQYPSPIIQDDILIAKLNKQKAIINELEIDTFIFSGTINDKNFKKPILPKMLLIADAQNGMILGQDVLSPEDDEIQKTLRMLIKCILDLGKPRTVYVRDEYFESILLDLCNKIGINIEIKGNLAAIDFFASSLEDSMFS